MELLLRAIGRADPSSRATESDPVERRLREQRRRLRAVQAEVDMYRR